MRCVLVNYNQRILSLTDNVAGRSLADDSKATEWSCVRLLPPDGFAWGLKAFFARNDVIVIPAKVTYVIPSAKRVGISTGISSVVIPAPAGIHSVIPRSRRRRRNLTEEIASLR